MSNPDRISRISSIESTSRRMAAEPEWQVWADDLSEIRAMTEWEREHFLRSDEVGVTTMETLRAAAAGEAGNAVSGGKTRRPANFEFWRELFAFSLVQTPLIPLFAFLLASPREGDKLQPLFGSLSSEKARFKGQDPALCSLVYLLLAISLLGPVAKWLFSAVLSFAEWIRLIRERRRISGDDSEQSGTNSGTGCFMWNIAWNKRPSDCKSREKSEEQGGRDNPTFVRE